MALPLESRTSFLKLNGFQSGPAYFRRERSPDFNRGRPKPQSSFVPPHGCPTTTHMTARLSLSLTHSVGFGWCSENARLVRPFNIRVS